MELIYNENDPMDIIKCIFKDILNYLPHPLAPDMIFYDRFDPFRLPNGIGNMVMFKDSSSFDLLFTCGSEFYTVSKAVRANFPGKIIFVDTPKVDENHRMTMAQQVIRFMVVPPRDVAIQDPLNISELTNVDVDVSEATVEIKVEPNSSDQEFLNSIPACLPISPASTCTYIPASDNESSDDEDDEKEVMVTLLPDTEDDEPIQTFMTVKSRAFKRSRRSMKNLCMVCGRDMGDQNPRQLCGKTRCTY
jgi:hypothetical protein